jgi:hypothetical protein
MSEARRAPWYRVAVQAGAAAIEVTLSDSDEARLFRSVAQTGQPMQIWAQRWDGSVEQLTVVPGHGVRYMAREARPIPIKDNRPAAQGEQATGEIAPTDTRYAQYCRPAVLRDVPYPVEPMQGLAEELRDLSRLISRAMSMDSAPDRPNSPPAPAGPPAPAKADAPPSMPDDLARA